MKYTYIFGIEKWISGLVFLRSLNTHRQNLNRNSFSLEKVLFGFTIHDGNLIMYIVINKMHSSFNMKQSMNESSRGE